MSDLAVFAESILIFLVAFLLFNVGSLERVFSIVLAIIGIIHIFTGAGGGF